MVATLARVSSARESADYYIESQASHRPPDDYYLCGEEPDGRWWNPHGLFGLEDGAKVDAKAFHRLHQGFAPFDPHDPDDMGEQTKLTRNAGSEARTAAFDITFSADKSVSTLWAMTDGHVQAELARAHDDAVRTALDLIVDGYCAKTRDRPTGEPIRTIDAQIMAATFRHESSRENDPQLHTHAVIFNAALAADGKWRALHGKGLYQWQKAAGAVYRNALAWNITQRLGFAVERYGRDGEQSRIAAVPQDLQDHWSKRRRAIVATAARMGFATGDNAARAGHVNRSTRRPKDQGMPRSVRAIRWDLDRTGFVEDVRAVLDAIPRHRITDEDRGELRSLVRAIPDDLTGTEAIFRVSDLVRRIAVILPGMMAPEHIEAVASRILERADVLELDRWGEGPDVTADLPQTRVFTTKAQLDRERDIEALAHSLAVRPAEDIDPDLVEKHIDRLAGKGTPLSAEQANAVRIGATGRRNIIIEGAAGSGKTTTLAPITEIAREAGWKVYGTAQAWRTANELAAATHIPSWCLMTLLNKIAKGQLELDAKSLVIVDEAGQLHVAHAARLLEIAAKTGARIIWTGDTRQQQPIGAGPGLRLLRNAVGSVRVTTIRRQRADAEDILVNTEGLAPAAARARLATMDHAERQEIVRQYRADGEAPRFVPWQITASSHLRDGFGAERKEAAASVARAVAAWRERGRLHLGRDLDATLQRLVGNWDRGRREAPERSTLVIARTHDEIGALTPHLRERALTSEQRAGEVTITVAGGNAENRHRQPRRILVAPGERLAIRTPCRDLGLVTGNLLTVERIETPEDGRGAPVRNSRGETRHVITARRDDGKLFIFEPDQVRDWSPERGLHGLPRIDYGYAMTFASAQGATVDHAHVLADDRPALETIYPAMTRHRDRLDVYVNAEPIRLTVAEDRPEHDDRREVTDEDVLDHLAAVWSRSAPKQAARDYILPPGERAAALEPLPPSDRGDAAPRDPAGYHGRRVRPRPPGGLSAINWLRLNRTPERKTPCLDRLVRTADQDTADRNHTAPYRALAGTIETIRESYRAVEERDRRDGAADALRSPAWLETLRTQRSLMDRAREALRRVVRRPEHARTAARAGITRESLVEWIHDHARRRRALAAAAARPSRSEHLGSLEAEWRTLIDAAEMRATLPLHVAGWRVAVERISAAVRDHTVPETSRRPLASILDSQRAALRYDRQARNLIRLIAATHEDAKALFAAARGPHDPTLGWTRIRERRDALQKAVDQLPPADEIDPYLAHYDARADSALGDVMLARLERNLKAAARHQLQDPAAELLRLAAETTALRGALRRTMRTGGLPALHDNTDLDRLREVARTLDRAVSAGSDILDPELERRGAGFAAMKRLSDETLAAIAVIDRRLDETVAGAARALFRLREDARRFSHAPRPDDNARGARLIVDFGDTLAALEEKLAAPSPADRIDAALNDLEDGLSLPALRTELRGFRAHLRLADQAFLGHTPHSRPRPETGPPGPAPREDDGLRTRDRPQAPSRDAGNESGLAADERRADEQRAGKKRGGGVSL